MWVGTAGLTLALGADYYRTPLPERPFAPLHELLAPTGLLGHGYGVVGTLMMAVGVTLYSLRKRVRWLSRLGRLSGWLQFHIFLCTLGPYLVLLHTTFKFGGIVSIAFWSMTVVVASGVFGRYVFARIPRTVDGRFRDLAEIEEEIRELEAGIRTSAGLSQETLGRILSPRPGPPPAGTVDALWLAMRGDLAARARLRATRRELTRSGIAPPVRVRVLALLRRRQRLAQQSRLLLPFQRLFGYWHVLHLPLALVLLVVTVVHVVVAVLFGYSWAL